MCGARWPWWRSLASLVLKTVTSDPNPKIFGNRLVVVLTEAPYRVFRSTLQGLNQLVVGLSPLSETTYPTGHDTSNDGS
jgi:hypothetical protein